MKGGDPAVVLTIAGSDSGGCAGVQADLRTFAALGVHGATALTAVTAQSTTGVTRVDVLTPEAVVAQVEAVIGDMAVVAVKTGMLANAAVAEAVAVLASAGRLPNLVVDPVMVASSGAVLASEEVLAVYRDRLMPLAAVCTPNMPEAAALAAACGAGSVAGQENLAKVLGTACGAPVVVKGGHLPGGETVVDVLWSDGRLHSWVRPRVDTSNTHGSGCTFAAAVAALLGAGRGLVDAVAEAGELVATAIRGGAGWSLGAGPGPLDHFGWSRDG